jgi:hypothetical protein
MGMGRDRDGQRGDGPRYPNRGIEIEVHFLTVSCIVELSVDSNQARSPSILVANSATLRVLLLVSTHIPTPVKSPEHRPPNWPLR